MDNKENKISPMLKNFIEKLSKGYEMTNEEKDALEKLAEEDITKLFHQKDMI